MEFFDSIKIRTSSRVFLEEQISEEELKQIILAGELAPVGSNKHKDLHMTVIQDPETLKKLGEAACVRRLDVEEMAKIVEDVANRDEILEASTHYDPFYGAPTVIVLSHRKQDLEPGIEFSNVGGVVQYMHLAAVNLGLGSCLMWYAWDSMRRIPELDHTDLLGLPEDFEPLIGLAVGHIESPLQPRNINPERIGVTRI